MSSIRALLAVTALAALAAACAKPSYEAAAGFGVTPTEQYPLRTEVAPQGIQLAPHDWGLSQNQADALKDLAARWREHREGMVIVEAPASGGPDAAATAYAARDALETFGVPAGAIQLVGYQDTGAPGAPIRVSHLVRKAKVDECGRQWADLTKTAKNGPSPNFGCSVNANLAAMIDNPADIDRPRGTDPADAGRRQVVIDAYRQGQPTSTQADEQADGTVSRAVN